MFTITTKWTLAAVVVSVAAFACTAKADNLGPDGRPVRTQPTARAPYSPNYRPVSPLAPAYYPPSSQPAPSYPPPFYPAPTYPSAPSMPRNVSRYVYDAHWDCYYLVTATFDEFLGDYRIVLVSGPYLPERIATRDRSQAKRTTNRSGSRDDAEVIRQAALEWGTKRVLDWLLK